MKIIYKIISVLTAVLVLFSASCSKEIIENKPQGLRFSTEIDTEFLISKSGDVAGQSVDVKSAQSSYTMKAGVSKMVPESGATKASLISEISSFKAAGYDGTTQCFSPQSVSVGTTYSYDWPKGQNRTFYACNNAPSSVTPSFTSDGVSVQFTSSNFPMTAGQQKDMVLGWYSGNGKVDGSYAGVAAMKFKHAMSAVRIVNNTSLTITSIKLSGVNNAGTVSCNASGDISWTGKGGSETVSQEDESGLAEDGETRVVGDPFILIPQNFSTSPMSVKIKDIEGLEYSGEVNCELDCGDICTITLQQVAGIPVVLSFRSEGTNTEVAWSKCPGCDAYEYSIDNKVTWKQIDGVDNTHVTLSDLSYNTSFTFYVRSVLDDTPSESSSLEIHTAPAPPTHVRLLGRKHTNATTFTSEKNQLVFNADYDSSKSDIRVKAVIETSWNGQIGAYSFISEDLTFEPNGWIEVNVSGVSGAKVLIHISMQLDDFVICDPDYSPELGYTSVYCYEKYPKGECFSSAVPIGDEDICVSDLPLLP